MGGRPIVNYKLAFHLLPLQPPTISHTVGVNDLNKLRERYYTTSALETATVPIYVDWSLY